MSKVESDTGTVSHSAKRIKQEEMEQTRTTMNIPGIPWCPTQPMTNLIDDLQLESDNNANELNSDKYGHYLPGPDSNYLEELKKEVENKVNDFSELSMKRVKRRARCIVDTYYTETFDPEPPKPPKKPATRRRSFLGRII